MNVITRIKLHFLMKKHQKELVKRMDDELKRTFSNLTGLEGFIKIKKKDIRGNYKVTVNAKKIAK